MKMTWTMPQREGHNLEYVKPCFLSTKIFFIPSCWKMRLFEKAASFLFSIVPIRKRGCLNRGGSDSLFFFLQCESCGVVDKRMLSEKSSKSVKRTNVIGSGESRRPRSTICPIPGRDALPAFVRRFQRRKALSPDSSGFSRRYYIRGFQPLNLTFQTSPSFFVQHRSFWPIRSFILTDFT